MRTTKYSMNALATRVLSVAVVHYEDGELFDWSVYVDGVPGHDHDNEFMKVARLGAKLSSEMAVMLFPEFDITKYRF